MDEGRLERTSNEAPYRVDGKDSSTLSVEANEVVFTIPLPFPSVNSLHNVIWSQRRVELKPEVRKFRNDAMVFIPRIGLHGLDSSIRVDLVFHFPLRYNNGKVRRRDCHNGVKVILDLIAQKSGFDDCRVHSGSWSSVDSLDEKVEVSLREIIWET